MGFARLAAVIREGVADVPRKKGVNMKSKGFKIVVGVLVVVILVLGGLLVAKNLGASANDATTQGGREIPAGAVADDPSLPLPPDGATEVLEPGDEAAN